MFESRMSVTLDKNLIRNNWDKIVDTPLSHAGNYIKRAAINSIKTAPRIGKKKRKNSRPQYSPPGKPPYSRDTRKRFKRILSIPEGHGYGRHVVVGHVGFPSRKNLKTVPEIHEFGGTQTITEKVFTPKQADRLGSNKSEARQRRKEAYKAAIRAGRIKPKERAFTIQRRVVQYPTGVGARRTMKPALDRSMDKVLKFWTDVVNPSTVKSVGSVT